MKSSDANYVSVSAIYVGLNRCLGKQNQFAAKCKSNQKGGKWVAGGDGYGDWG